MVGSGCQHLNTFFLALPQGKRELALYAVDWERSTPCTEQGDKIFYKENPHILIFFFFLHKTIPRHGSN